jgi:hypothetical protein
MLEWMDSANTVASSSISPSSCSKDSEITEYLVCLKNIPRDLTRRVLQAKFLSHIPRNNVRCPPRKCKKGGYKNRGYATVHFSNLNEAMELVNKMDGFQIDEDHIIEAIFL